MEVLVGLPLLPPLRVPSRMEMLVEQPAAVVLQQLPPRVPSRMEVLVGPPLLPPPRVPSRMEMLVGQPLLPPLRSRVAVAS